MNYRLWAIGLSLISLQAAANIRVIGNGGGEQEMLALTRYSMIKDYLRFCLRAENHCDLSPTEYSLIEGAIAKSIDRDADTLIPVRLLAAELDANRSMLLGMIAFSVLRSYESVEQYPRDWVSLSYKLFSLLNWKSTDLFLPMSTQRLRSFEVSGRIERVHVFLENEMTGQSQDITADLIRQLPCKDKNVKLIGVNGKPHLELTGFSAELKWSCQGTQFMGRLFARHLNPDKESSTKPEVRPAAKAWAFLVFGSQVVEPISCPQTLISLRK